MVFCETSSGDEKKSIEESMSQVAKKFLDKQKAGAPDLTINLAGDKDCYNDNNSNSYTTRSTRAILKTSKNNKDKTGPQQLPNKNASTVTMTSPTTIDNDGNDDNGNDNDTDNGGSHNISADNIATTTSTAATQQDQRQTDIH